MSAKTGRAIDWDYFHSLQEPRFVGGVLVLTVKAFAAGQGHSNSGFHNATEVLAKHHYHASGWPKKHPRFLHPVYREVELCNWKPDCVHDWDRNTTAFALLPKERQDIMIAEAKEKYDREEEERLAKEKEEADRAEEDRRREERERICGVPREEEHREEEHHEEEHEQEAIKEAENMEKPLQDQEHPSEPPMDETPKDEPPNP
jgi:hypothetical protein